ncbi:MAG: hypothetical protein ACK5PZ_22665 [Pirellula sp.]
MLDGFNGIDNVTVTGSSGSFTVTFGGTQAYHPTQVFDEWSFHDSTRELYRSSEVLWREHAYKNRRNLTALLLVCVGNANSVLAARTRTLQRLRGSCI